KYCQSNETLKVVCAFNPRFWEALAEYFNCCTAHSVRDLGLLRYCSGANASNNLSYAGCTATSCPCRWVESSVISSPRSCNFPLYSSAYVLLSATFCRSKYAGSPVGICTPLNPNDFAHLPMFSIEL